MSTFRERLEERMQTSDRVLDSGDALAFTAGAAAALEILADIDERRLTGYVETQGGQFTDPEIDATMLRTLASELTARGGSAHKEEENASA